MQYDGGKETLVATSGVSISDRILVQTKRGDRVIMLALATIYKMRICNINKTNEL